MTPTLAGRMQTRLLLALVPGLTVALGAAGLLDHLTLGGALVALLAITGLGLCWDAAYQGRQDQRWDRDWPRLFTLLSWVPEAFGSWLFLHLLGAAAPLGTHLMFFTLLWVPALLGQVALLPVLLPHWRHEGRRLTAVRTAPAAPPAAASHVALPPEKERNTRPGPRALDLRPGGPRFATVALFVGVIAAVVLLAPLLGKADRSATSADPRLTNGEEQQAVQVQRAARTRSWDTTQRVLPQRVEFPAAGLDTKLSMTLMKQGGVLVTPDPDHAAWYGQGAAPGQRGPAVIIGSTDAIFTKLDHARRGQYLRVIRTDGSQVGFTVDRVRTVEAGSFPTQQVYGATRRPLLRLIGYDEGSGRNVIVFAHATSVTDAEEE